MRDAPRRLQSWVAAWLVGWLLAVTAAAVPAQAQQPAAVVDPPARVGRLAFASGHVEVYNERRGEWQPAPINTPITSRTALWVDEGALAEWRVGTTALRIDGGTQVNVVQLDEGSLQLDVPRGSVSLRLRQWQSGERVLLSGDGISLAPQGPGIYRLDVQQAPRQVVVKSLQGEALLQLGPSALAPRLTLAAGQQLTIDPLVAQVVAAADAQRNDFDRFAARRDAEFDRAAVRHVSPEMTGAELLEQYGSWTQDAHYGPVWYPRGVPGNWAPYRYGHWEWIEPWGWTWIDDMPWGFAPTHYGRWVFLGGAWGWVPGSYVARPVFAPALVGFYGSGGSSVSFSFSSGGPSYVGWFPLGPGEVWLPAYRTTNIYIRNVNITHVTQLPPPGGPPVPVRDPRRGVRDGRDGQHPYYRYAQTSFAATIVPQSLFAPGRRAADMQAAVAPAQIVATPVAGTAVWPAWRGGATDEGRPAPQRAVGPERGSDPFAAAVAAPAAQRLPAHPQVPSALNVAPPAASTYPQPQPAAPAALWQPPPATVRGGGAAVTLPPPTRVPSLRGEAQGSAAWPPQGGVPGLVRMPAERNLKPPPRVGPPAAAPQRPKDDGKAEEGHGPVQVKPKGVPGREAPRGGHDTRAVER
jgi:hypothetical protein